MVPISLHRKQIIYDEIFSRVAKDVENIQVALEFIL